ncbi:MAG: hypothetical protein IMY84_00425 [Chloroflexi bacterium]|nr:hypothetical protein [Chloroflexota bacterium]
MANEAKRLIAALAAQDQIKGYTANLEKLKEDGSVTEEQYATARAEYDQRLAAGSSEVQTLRTDLGRQLEATKRDLETYRFELGRVEARYKVGEIPLARFRSEDKKLRVQIGQLEQSESELANLITADSAAGLIAPATKAKSATPSRVSRPTPAAVSRAPGRTTPSAPSLRMSGAGILGSKLRIAALVAAVVLLVSVRMPWLAASEMLGADLGSEAGVSVSFLAGLGGLILGIGSIVAAFFVSGRTRGILHIVAGVLALAALGAAVALGELPLLDTYFRQLVVLREGFYAYITAAVALIVMGGFQVKAE